MRSFIIIVLFGVSCSTIAQPNNDSTITRARIDSYYLKSYLFDYKDIALCPLKPSVSKYAAISAYAGTMYLLVNKYDEKIQTYSQEHKSELMDKLSRNVFEPVGSGLYPFSAVAIIYTHGLVFKNQKSKKVALNCVKSFIIASSFAQISKYAFSRQRPNVNPPDAHQWFSEFGSKSFFSGHTTTAFSIATVIAEEYKKTVWVPVLCYSVVTCTGLSRIYDNKHWASDVLTGALVGYLCGRLAVHKNNWGIQIVPRIILN